MSNNDKSDPRVDNFDSEMHDMEELLQTAFQLTDVLEERVTAQDKIIGELRGLLAEQLNEVVEQEKLLIVYQREEEQRETDKQKMQEEIDNLRRNVKRFKEDSNVSRSLLRQGKKFGSSLDELVTRLTELNDLIDLSTESSREKVVVEESTGAVNAPLAKGVFICCGDGHYQKENLGRFQKLKEQLPEIVFPDDPIMIRSDSPDRPPIPMDVDVVILFTLGLSHSDGNALRNVIRNSSKAHIISHSYISLLVQQLREWLKNPNFARVSVSVPKT